MTKVNLFCPTLFVNSVIAALSVIASKSQGVYGKSEIQKRARKVHPLFHSDSGFLYTGRISYSKLQAAKMRQSMSRVGRCIDVGPMESFWGMLKSEMYYLHRFTDRDDLILAIENYIHFYNNGRYQKRLHCMTTMESHYAYAA